MVYKPKMHNKDATILTSSAFDGWYIKLPDSYNDLIDKMIKKDEADNIKKYGIPLNNHIGIEYSKINWYDGLELFPETDRYENGNVIFNFQKYTSKSVTNGNSDDKESKYETKKLSTHRMRFLSDILYSATNLHKGWITDAKPNDRIKYTNFKGSDKAGKDIYNLQKG